MPHSMKQFPFFFALLGLAILTSCNHNTEDYTPYISFSFFYVNPVIENDSLKAADDTITFPTYDAELGAYIFDTLTTFDTLFCVTAFGAYTNNLTAAHIEHDAEALSIFTNKYEDLSKALKSFDTIPMSLYFKSGYNLAVIPVYVAPKKAGVWKIRFVCESDSHYSPTTQTFLLPVK